MNVIPWRVKKLLSDGFPLLYHLAVNATKPANSAEYWDQRLAETWDDPKRHWPAKNRLIAELTGPRDRILDIACGNGGILRYLHGLGYEAVEGLEISKYAIERLSAEGITMHRGTLPEIPLPDARYDVVIASQVLEHVIRRRRFLEELCRILKPGGRLFIFVPDDCLGPIDEDEHVIKYNLVSLARFLGRYGKVERIESMGDDNHPMSVLFAVVRPGRTNGA